MRHIYAVPAIVIVSAAVAFGLLLIAPVQASEPNGCEVIGTVGNVIVSRCIDEETNIVIFANSQGFLVVEP